jgi:hypothetical protein
VTEITGEGEIRPETYRLTVEASNSKFPQVNPQRWIGDQFDFADPT